MRGEVPTEAISTATGGVEAGVVSLSSKAIKMILYCVVLLATDFLLVEEVL